jgi:hypothetical protein
VMPQWESCMCRRLNLIGVLAIVDVAHQYWSSGGIGDRHWRVGEGGSHSVGNWGGARRH